MKPYFLWIHELAAKPHSPYPSDPLYKQHSSSFVNYSDIELNQTWRKGSSTFV